MSAQKALTQSARVVRAFVLGVDLGVESIFSVCCGGGVLGCCSISKICAAIDLVVGAGAESISMSCDGGNASLTCSISSIGLGQDEV